MGGVRLSAALAVASLLAACSGDTTGYPPDFDYHVADRFDVGANIYVRALAVEPDTDTLCVGTSMGVM